MFVCALSFSVSMYVSVLAVYHTPIHTEWEGRGDGEFRKGGRREKERGTEGERSSFNPKSRGTHTVLHCHSWICRLLWQAAVGDSLAWDNIWFGLCAPLLPPFNNVNGSLGPSPAGTRHTPGSRQGT